MRPLAIRTEHLTRHFGGLRAVDDLTIDVPPGIVFGFLGPNGSGKTTTIRLLLGLIRAHDGRADVLGFDVARQAEAVRSRTGALLEHTGLYERLSAEDNLEYYGRIARMPDSERRARVKDLLLQTGLWERRRDPVRLWSRGMKQKLAVARTLLARPALVFLDEPTGGLDPVAAAALREDLAALGRRDGTTVFLTTHNLTEAERLCGQVAVIRDGRLLAVGAPDDLRRQRQENASAVVTGRGFTPDVVERLRAREDVAAARVENESLHLELRATERIAPLVALMVASGVEIEEIRRPTASLEDLFLDLVEDAREEERQTA